MPVMQPMPPAAFASSPISMVVEFSRFQLREVAGLHQMPAHIDAQVALPDISIIQGMVPVALPYHHIQPVRAITHEQSNQRWVVAGLIVRQQLWQIMPVSNRQTATERRHKVTIEIEVGMSGI
jgi:hypothetical protein